MNPQKLWQRIQQGHLNNISFRDFCRLLEAFGFEFARQSGTSHRIYSRDDLREILTVLPQDDGSAWPYQVRDLKRLVAKYDLELGKGVSGR